MVATSKLLNLLSGSWPGKVGLSSRTTVALQIAVVVVTISTAAPASPLSKAAFGNLASRCAAGTDIATLRAVASVESQFDPLAVRDNTSRESWKPPSAAEAVAITRKQLSKGHSIDLGLMQINSVNLAAMGMTVESAFDACRSLAAGHFILLSAFAAGSSETERQAAILISLSRYNTGRPLAGIVNGYTEKVIAAQSSPNFGNSKAVELPESQQAWNVWGAVEAQPDSSIFASNKTSEIERAGAQTSDARSEGRAPASPVEKGEPYVLSAFQESEPR